jgi:tetratricopeptide (TPR) repeat protein
MILDNARLLFRLYVRPVAAMSGILDQGSWVFGVAGMIVVSLLLQSAVGTPLPYVRGTMMTQYGQVELGSPFSFYSPAVLVAMFFAPAAILAIALVAQLGGFSYLFSRDYLSLITCTTMAWTAAHLPFALIAFALRGAIAPSPAVWAPGFAAFTLLAVCAIRVVFGTTFAQAAIAAILAWAPLAAGMYWYRNFGHVFGYLASPFLLYFAYLYFGGQARSLGQGMRNRQAFKRYLDICTVNEHDAEAQYQLGLIYQQRRQHTEAMDRFRKAIAIDPSETDAHFQLGKIAREQGRLAEALERFQAVVDQNEKHALSEIWREVGALHLAAKQFQAAREELATYVERRPYDPEGLYYFGQALENTGETARAKEMYARAMEAVKTAPSYRRGIVRRWSRMAHAQLRRLQ